MTVDQVDVVCRTLNAAVGEENARGAAQPV
jgi:hypothetical protein